MTATDVFGTIGVTLLLLAFLLNVRGKIGRNTPIYLTLNAIGAALACWAAWQIPFLPFVLLEGTWAAYATWCLLGLARKRSAPET